MSDDIQALLHISSDVVTRKAKDNKWIDLKCSHLAPINGTIEALNFRITSIDGDKFKAEIHWDTGTTEIITDSIPRDCVFYYLQGYYSHTYIQIIQSRAADKARILVRRPELMIAVDGLCLKFDGAVGDAVNEMELESLINSTGISLDGVGARLECVSEMKLMRQHMDIVFGHTAKGDMQWTELQFKSLYTVNLLINLLDDIQMLCEVTRRDHTDLVWILHELRINFRLSMQRSYQMVFMHVAKGQLQSK
jgi:hypothetical protein